jgi:hypothetical protein
MSNKNDQIDAFLDYYYALPTAPQYAVLITGNWGSGKTWFIRRSLDKLKKNNGRVLYVSLYGISSTKGIEDEFFQQLHPVLGSKGMAIGGKLVKGFLKGALKIDWDNDGRDDGTASIGIPDIDIPTYLKNTEGMVLVFDDVERCSIPIGDLLGYINYFVEHGGYKAVLVANEKEILDRDSDEECKGKEYRRIKEKLIGKTFEVEADLQGAVASFIDEMHEGEAKKTVAKNALLIHDLYRASNYKNLRHLRQALLDYGRIVALLRDAHLKHEELLRHLLSFFLIYSMEIKSGKLQPQDIAGMRSDYSSFLSGTQRDLSESVYARLKTKYLGFTPVDALLPDKLWIELMSTGLLDRDALADAISKSKYFPQEQPEWMRLWNAYSLGDDEIARLLKIVHLKFEANEYTEIGVLRHVCGILLEMSSLGIFAMSREEIFKESVAKIDALKAAGFLSASNINFELSGTFGYGGFGFRFSDSPEFVDLSKYIEKRTKEAIEEAYPREAGELLLLMEKDTRKFARMLILNNHEDNRYYKTPILSYINDALFVRKVAALEPSALGLVAGALKERYSFADFRGYLMEERTWLETVSKLLSVERKSRAGRMSGELLGHLCTTITQSAKLLEETSSLVACRP